MNIHPLGFILFNLFVVVMLMLDLGVFHRAHRPVRFRESILWCGFWIVLALLFNLGIYLYWPDPAARSARALEFITGYVIEYSLSVDNIFVFIVIISYFKIPPKYQHRVLFWGIIGAILLRGFFILVGVTLINMFSWIIYVFGALLIVTGIRMAIKKEEEEVDLENNFVIRLLRRKMPVTPRQEGPAFFVRQSGRWAATPLFMCLVAIETMDVVFAVDSIPAILAITQDPFIVYSSNIFAIFGLRSLYFALANLLGLFVYLHYGLAVVLTFIGVKMLLSEHYHISVGLSLAVVGAILLVTVLASLLSTALSKKRARK